MPISALEENRPVDGVTYLADPESFHQVPGSPFAYWVSDAIQRKFTELPRLGSDGRTAEHGASTKEDFRFLRTWWEARSSDVLGWTDRDRKDFSEFAERCLMQIWATQGWVPFAKGGDFSRYYSDVYLIINWSNDADEMEARLLQKYPYLGNGAN